MERPDRGMDHPLTGCIVLLRPSSAKAHDTDGWSGLRTVDPDEYPELCGDQILDFGTSSLVHGSLEQMWILRGMWVPTLT